MKFENKRKSHLKSKLIIDQLFSEGQVITKKPFRLIYLKCEDPNLNGVQHFISVPKKRFKLAVTRNRIRRIISEAYRLHANEIKQQFEHSNTYLAIGIIYIGKKEIRFSEIEKQMKDLLAELISKQTTYNA
ncbi:ribonuclease P protein component [bacterium SCSIO 12643]|nr:ribonuclease P protein component [bacterium SCSIO 12643]